MKLEAGNVKRGRCQSFRLGIKIMCRVGLWFSCSILNLASIWRLSRNGGINLPRSDRGRIAPDFSCERSFWRLLALNHPPQSVPCKIAMHL